MHRRRIVLLLIPHLGGGGAEQVAALLARGLDPSRYEVHLALVTQTASAARQMPQSITVHGLGLRRVRWAGWRLLRLVWKLRPDVVLSGMAHLNRLVLSLRPLFPKNTRLLVRQNAHFPAHRHARSSTLYSRAEAIICQTPAMATEFAARGGSPCAVRVLPNPVDADDIRLRARHAPVRWPGPGPHVLAVGRLAREKGFDLLLPAFADLRSTFPPARLAILGEGRERPALQMLAWTLGLADSVRMPGYVDHPAEWYPGATVFVLSSRHDALPNALLEAAAGGLPIVATPASAGLVELLQGRPGVWLARDTTPGAISHALRQAIDAARHQPRFAHEWIEPFRIDAALPRYQALIEEQFAAASQ